MLIRRCVPDSIRPGNFAEAIMPECLFFEIDVSIAGCRYPDGEPYDGYAPESTRPRPDEVGPLPPAPAVARDEEPSWPEERFFHGNDVY